MVERSPFVRQRGSAGWVVLGVVAVLALALLAWLVTGSGSAPPVVTPAPPPAAAPAEVASPFGAASAVVGPELWGGDELTRAASGLMSPMHLEQLRQLLNGRAGRDAEYSRLIEALTHQRAVRRFHESLTATGPSPETIALAKQVEAGIDTRLERFEYDLPEAATIRASVMELLQADEAERARLMTDWLAQRERMPRPPPGLLEMRSAELALLSEWATGPTSPQRFEALARAIERTRNPTPPGPS